MRRALPVLLGAGLWACGPSVPSLARFEVLPAGGPDCAEGGTATVTGLDIDLDGLLGDEEVLERRVACAGLPRSNEPASGPDTLVRVDPAGEACPGGVVVSVGSDLDGDGVLAASEVQTRTLDCEDARVRGDPGVFHGDLTIHDTLDLAEAEGLVSVTGALSILDFGAPRLDALSSLASVGSLLVERMPSLVSLDGLDGLSTVQGDVTLEALPSVVDVSALTDLSTGGRLTLDGLEALEHVLPLATTQAAAIRIVWNPRVCEAEVEALRAATTVAIEAWGNGSDVSCAP